MPSIQIKDVPEGVHGTLRKRAAVNGQSLQEYLLGLLTEEARTPTLNEVLDGVGAQTGGAATFEETVALLREDRDSR
jgi:antitoxin FitA